MTPAELAQAVAAYREGIEAELELLTRIDVVASRQREVSIAHDFEAFHAPSDERDRLTESLVAIERNLRELRQLLADHRRDAERVPGFAQAVALHRQATDIVAKILTADREALHALADADIARRAALAHLDQGETTLAAYRKVLVPAGAGSLVDQRG